MNRIILIGNGFDLAHNLKTSYEDFLVWLWEDLATKLKDDWRAKKYGTEIIIRKGKMFHYDNARTNYQKLSLNIEQGNVEIVYKNLFLEIITKKIFLKNWVDLEEEYYQQIKNIVQGNPNPYKHEEKPIIKLNEDFEIIKQALNEYLSEITSKDIAKTENMSHLFYDGFELEDFQSSKENLFIEFAADVLFNYKFDNTYSSVRSVVFEDIVYKCKIKEEDVTVKHVIENLRQRDKLHLYGMKIYPQNTLILNFNYTNTEAKYVVEGKPTHSIHIHGELNNDKNPIIFGYGDELADEYKEIENLKNKDFFKNIKSINYLKTGNYRNLLSFIDSNYYQVFILGHSCGNSDRTLLNTLFEHKNCVSIKPFFYEKEENGMKQDDYEDIIINISRNFNDKKAFREKVVNRTRCCPLPQLT